MDWQQLAETLSGNEIVLWTIAGALVAWGTEIWKRCRQGQVGTAQEGIGAGWAEKKIVPVVGAVLVGAVRTVAAGDWSWGLMLSTAMGVWMTASGLHNVTRKAPTKPGERKRVEDLLKGSGSGLIILLCVVLLMAPVCVVADESPAVADAIDTGFGMIEARAYKPLFPDTTLEFGGGLAVQLLVVPEDLLVLGSMLGGHRVFADVAYVRGQCAFGGSVSLRGAAKDDGLRLFGVLWKEDDFEASGGVAYGWKVDLKELF